MSYNRVTLVGNLGRDAELRYTAGGTAVSTLNMATTDKWTDKDGQKQERTEWHRVVVWGNPAEALQEYLVKGKQVLVDGSLQTRKWTDKDGTDRWTTEIKAQRVVLLGGGGKNNRRPEPDAIEDDAVGGDDTPQQESPAVTDDDIPF